MDDFATLTFDRAIAADPATVWQVWTAPAARALWSSPSPAVTVDYLSAETSVGGREVSLCRAAGQPDIRCEVGWLALEEGKRSVNYEVVESEGVSRSAALVTASVRAEGSGSHVTVTVQLSNLSQDMAAGYRAGFGAGMANLSDVAERTMVIERVIRAPLSRVWGVWLNAETLPHWWGPDGFSCRTKRIDLRQGGEWVFDMVAPDGTVFPNHHRYHDVTPQSRIGYTLHWGEDGPKHADAWVSFAEQDGATKVTLCMAMATVEEYRQAKGFGAVELGLQTLGKLARAAGEA